MAGGTTQRVIAVEEHFATDRYWSGAGRLMFAVAERLFGIPPATQQE